MSNESTTPGGDPDRGIRPDETGIIDLQHTRPVPRADAPPEPSDAATRDTSESGDTTDGTAASGDDAWFDVFGSEHPSQGAGVPARADGTWGSDRADALAEEAHRASYAPPAAAAAAAADAATADGPPGPGASTVSSPLESPHLRGSGDGFTWPRPSGEVSFSDAPPPEGPAWAGQVTAGPGGNGSSRPPRRSRRALLVGGVIALCLFSGIIGGVTGQLIGDRVTPAGSTLPEPGPGATDRPAGSIANIAATVLPSVVTIKVDGGSEGSATGSGFVLDAKGHVLTNNHVVEGGASAAAGNIEVVLSNGDTEKATIVGRDVSYDLAVLKISRTDLTPLALGPSSKVVVGDQVIAVGAPLGLDQTVTTGIVSALNRPVTPGGAGGDEMSYINAIQTDAAINPGNSGGPLLDLSGKVIGINSAIARVPGTGGTAGGSIGLGFAIPSDQARRTADQLIATGKATHPVIGVSLDRTFSGDGARVASGADSVTSGSPAAKAGVRTGDVITGFEGKRVRTPDQLVVSIRSRAVGDTVTLTVQRGGASVDLKMTLEADPRN
ncbi:MAG: trypsin-like peptidase domain-containing protein [Humibacillus sp.]